VRILVRRLGSTILLLLVPFAIVTVLGGWGHAPDLPGGLVPVAVVVIGLLAADVVLPVPSSAVLVAAGAALGPITGAIAGIIGVVAGATVGYALGARFGPQPGGPDAERARLLFERWGPAALVITRPVPLLAESTAVVAGSTRMNLGWFLAAVVAGAIPTCVGLALAGHAGGDRLDGGEIGAVLVITASFAVATALFARRGRPIRCRPAS
jgi:membrane protein DedA with SNARE-associated domain